MSGEVKEVIERLKLLEVCVQHRSAKKDVNNMQVLLEMKNIVGNIISDNSFNFTVKSDEETAIDFYKATHVLCKAYKLYIPRILNFIGNQYNVFICSKCDKVIFKHPVASDMNVVTETVDDIVKIYKTPKCNCTSDDEKSSDKHIYECGLKMLMESHECI